ncbi:MAG TPA: pyridoxal phosphate-dependent aminotransferase [Burkholderiales bacterium]|nr:pyridoxal phosphate-dependent aminotransferase [Burkholderiales bacterium]
MPEFALEIASKLPNVGTTIFTVMSRLAQECNAINLSQGFPDFDCDPALQDRVTHYMKAGYNQYPPMAGVVPLREAIAEKVQALYGARYDPEHEITVTPGGTYAIFTAVATVIRPGDEVIVFEPTYDSYVPAIETMGGKPVYVRLRFPDYSIDWEAVQAAITPRTRMIMINTPNNPTGSVFSADDMRALARVLRGTPIVVLSDEVYEHIVFDGAQHQSAARFPELAERSFIVSSFGKTYHVTGWKMGYCIAPKALMTEFRKVHQFNCFTCNTPVQYALADYMQNKDAYLGLAEFYQRKRDLFNARMEKSRFVRMPNSGTFFQLYRYDAISSDRDTELAIRWTREFGVASIPVSVFYHEPVYDRVIRFCFAKKDETLERGAELLCGI